MIRSFLSPVTRAVCHGVQSICWSLACVAHPVFHPETCTAFLFRLLPAFLSIHAVQQAPRHVGHSADEECFADIFGTKPDLGWARCLCTAAEILFKDFELILYLEHVSVCV